MTGDGYREHAPSPSLAPFVECFWTKSRAAGGGETQRVLPDGCADFLFQLAGTDPRGVLVGTMTRPHDVPAKGPVSIVAVRFRPGGARPFLGRSLEEWADAEEDLSALWGGAERCVEDLLRPGTAAQRAGRLAAALESCLPRAAPLDPRLARALARIVRQPHATHVGALAAECGWSRQHLTRLVKDATGIGPKRLLRVARMRRLLGLAPPGGPRGWADVAAACGFADQAHLVREFRELVGTTPARWFA